MENNDDGRVIGKSKPKWNIFQRGIRNKSGALSDSQLCHDPSELQRVSFATSIDDLPTRPSAFQQVLSEINDNNPSSIPNMSQLSNRKKIGKEARNQSPQGRKVSSTSSSPLPPSVEITQPLRPRSHSNSSSPMMNSESVNADNEQDLAMLNQDDGTLSVDTSVKASTSAGGSSSIAAGALLLMEPSELVPTNTGVSDMAPSAQLDTVDGPMTMSDMQRNKQTAENLKQKIMKTSEAVKAEQGIKDENVTEYLRLSNNADKQQLLRIKTVFEKKNSKSNATISQLQKKLDSYHKKLRELESGNGRALKLRDVGANLRDFSGGVVDSFKHATQNAAGAIVNKPKDLASKLKSRFGSSDNISAMNFDSNVKTKDGYESPSDSHYLGSDASSNCGSIDNVNSGGSDFLNVDEGHNERFYQSPESPAIARREFEQIHSLVNQLVVTKAELQTLREAQDTLNQDWQQKKNQLQNLLSNQLEGERLRHEEQLNDLNEFHRREMLTMKQELSSVEEKMEYHAHERARDMQEALESCQTRIAKMELQQQQQSVSVEGLENANARALVGKLINLLLSVMAVLLVLVSAVSGILMPFIKSQGRVFVTVIVTTLSVMIYRNWHNFAAWYHYIWS